MRLFSEHDAVAVEYSHLGYYRSILVKEWM